MKWVSLSLGLLLVVDSYLPAQDKYAVVIGVETYDAGTFDPLDYANEDALDLGKSLTSLGFTTKVMTSDATSSTLRPSTPAKIETIMRTVANSCGKGDTLVISLSGHGVQFADEPLLPSGVRETYFCPEDATLSDKSTLLKISSVVDFINSSAASRKLLLVDSCRENVLSDQGKRKSARRIELGSVHESRQSVPTGMAVLFSCSSKQFSWEHDELGHSVFTNYVINYLSGKAEERFYESGSVDLDGLVYYVRKRTNDYVSGKNLSADGQLPILRGDSANWSFGKIELSQPQEFTNGIGMQFTLIPAGEFMMGNEASVDELLKNSGGPVTLTSDFYLCTTEVTQRQFREIQSGEGPWDEHGDATEFRKDDNCPATYVTLDDAKNFCEALTNLERKSGRLLINEEYRLPTSIEWRIAASRNVDPVVNGQIAWFEKNCVEADENFAHPVASKRPGALGLFDILGNVWEWCLDPYGEDPQIGSVCGGAWNSSADQCSISTKTPFSRDSRDATVGFRVCKTKLQR